MKDTTNKILLIILIVLIFIAGALAWFVFKTPVTQQQSAKERCTQEFLEVKEETLGAICTAEFAHMRCLYDKTIIKEAVNGCEISLLESLGWQRTKRDAEKNE
ncbi:MAG: hypothetical protein WD003_00085 [Candidatus Paceibacterota bacterium]